MRWECFAVFRSEINFIQKNPRKHIDIKRTIKGEMERGHENTTSAFIEIWTQRVSGYSLLTF